MPEQKFSGMNLASLAERQLVIRVKHLGARPQYGEPESIKIATFSSSMTARGDLKWFTTQALVYQWTKGQKPNQSIERAGLQMINYYTFSGDRQAVWLELNKFMVGWEKDNPAWLQFEPIVAYRWTPKGYEVTHSLTLPMLGHLHAMSILGLLIKPSDWYSIRPDEEAILDAHLRRLAGAVESYQQKIMVAASGVASLA